MKLLYTKAGDFVEASDELNDVIARLARFHLANTYMGSIRFVMKGSGMEDLWKTISYPNIIEHMITEEMHISSSMFTFSARLHSCSVYPRNH